VSAPQGKREFRILGPFEAREDGHVLEVGPGKRSALLAFLLLDAGEVVSTDRLIDALWGESPPASALNSVHIYVSQLRKVLGEGCLVTRGHGYLLVLEPEQLDLGRFERLLGEGRELLARGRRIAQATFCRRRSAFGGDRRLRTSHPNRSPRSRLLASRSSA
jgi:DNA-binding SARP family transcriptional activator